MKDIELLDKLFRYLYDNGEIKSYDDVMRECGFNENQINEKEILKFQRLLVSSGFVTETNKRYENNPFSITLNDSGINMIIEYGGFNKYLKQKRKEKAREQNVKQSTIRLNYATIIISMGTFIGGVLLSNPVKELWKILLSIFE